MCRIQKEKYRKAHYRLCSNNDFREERRFTDKLRRVERNIGEQNENKQEQNNVMAVEEERFELKVQIVNNMTQELRISRSMSRRQKK